MLRLSTFGNLAVTRDEESLGPSATQRRRLALLALLAVAGDRGLPRDKILAFLWPESGEERARHSLTQSLYALRRDLREDELFLGTADLKLNSAAITSDVADFTEAIARRDYERAVALHAAPFLDGCFLSDAPEFERWAESERAQFRHQMASALETLAATATATGDHRAAADWWRRLASLDPLNSRVAVGLMTALAAAGNASGALQHARIHETLVRSELDAPPDAAVLRLVEHLRAEKVAAPSAPVDVSRGTRLPTAPAMSREGQGKNPASTVAPMPTAAAAPPSAPLKAGDPGRQRSAPLRLLTTTTWHAVETANTVRRWVALRRAVLVVAVGVALLLVWGALRHLATR
jgi:DNA-binding SARP family transcriptional activator